jgi:periplasmic protein CpxP/Spy
VTALLRTCFIVHFIDRPKRRFTTMTAETRTMLEGELKRFASDLSLSETQKEQLKTALESARERLEEIHKNHPDVTKADVIAKFAAARDGIRAKVVAFLTADQLKKWDAEVGKAKTFLGYGVKA